MIELAIAYARRGWPVFPLAPDSKVPAIAKDRGGNGCLDATLDLNRVEQWWGEYPQANVGIATGRRAGLLVIDVDPNNAPGWLDSLQSLKLPRTFVVRTWSGGWHLYFAYDFTRRITLGAKLLPGIDWRGQGGYVVAPGSVVNGRLYEIARNAPIAPAPAALIERIEAARHTRRVEIDASGHMVLELGRRNDTLMRVGCAMRRWGVEFNAILAALSAINSEHCEPALDEDELRQIAASCARYEPARVPQGAA